MLHKLESDHSGNRNAVLIGIFDKKEQQQGVIGAS